MNKVIFKILVLSVVLSGFTASVNAQDRPKLGVGYEEGLAMRYFFTDRFGGQFNIGLKYLGGHDAYGTTAAENSEADAGFGGAFLVNLFKSQYVNMDAMGQLAFAYDDTRNDNDVGDRTWVFMRAALAPEILISSHVGLGMRFGIELASMSDTKVAGVGGVINDTNDGTTNFQFYGPANPFYGSTLGMALYVYLDSFK